MFYLFLKINFHKKKLLLIIIACFLFSCSYSGSSVEYGNKNKNVSNKQQPQYNQPTQTPDYYNQQQSYQPQPPNSKYFNNPYVIPQNQYPYPYYDGDQYYVPPTSYGVSRDNMFNSANQKF